jgi:hypothetical protein
LTGIIFRRGGAEPDVTDFKAAVVDQRVQFVRATAGDRYERLELSALVQRVVVTHARGHAAEELSRRWTALRPEEILQSPYALIGTVDEIVDDLQERRKHWGISYYVTHEPYVDAFAPVVARLAGK